MLLRNRKYQNRLLFSDLQSYVESRQTVPLRHPKSGIRYPFKNLAAMTLAGAEAAKNGKNAIILQLQPDLTI